MRFSLKTMLMASAFCALLLASWFARNHVWGELFLLLTFLVLLAGAMACWFGPAERRPAWGSFTLAAALYLAITVYPGNFEGFPTSSLIDGLNERAHSVRLKIWRGTLIDYGGPSGLYLNIHGGAIPMNGTTFYPPAAGTSAVWSPVPADSGLFHLSRYNTNAKRVGHCVFALLLGFGAMAFVRYVVLAPPMAPVTAAAAAPEQATSPARLRWRFADQWSRLELATMKRIGLVTVAMGSIGLVAVASYAGREVRLLTRLPQALAVLVFVSGCGLILAAERKKRVVVPDAPVTEIWSRE